MRAALEQPAGKPGWPDLGSLGRDTLLQWAVQIFWRLSGVAVLAVLSRTLTAADIGVFFFALSFAETFIVFASLNLDTVMMRRVASNPERASEQIAPLFGFRLVSSPLYLLCTLVAARFLAPNIWPVILIVAMSVLAESLYFSLAGLFIALRKVIYTFTIGITVQALYLLLFLAGMEAAPSLGALLGVNLFRACALCVGAALVSRRLFHAPKPAWSTAFLREGAPFMLLLVVALMQEKVDTLLLGFLVDYQAVGLYSLALRVITAASFVPTAMAAVFFPRLAAERITRRNQAILLRALALLAALGVTAAAVGFIGAVPLTRVLYGQLSGAVARLLRPLALLIPIQFLAIFLSVALQALRQEKKALIAQAVCTGSSVLLNVILIPAFAVDGAIAVRLFSSALQLILLAGFLWRMISQPAVPALQTGEQ
jgi:polysaccharide transporter, PST family